MSADMIVFNNPEFGEVRRVEIDGEYWCVAYDVARALGYRNGSRDVHRHVDEEDKMFCELPDAYGNERQMLILNESGVYALIFSSKLPNSKKFKKWVTSEVLPSIRKTGTYTAPAAPAPMSPAQLIAAQAQILVDMEQKMAQIQGQTQAIQDQYNQLSQKVDTAVKVLSRPSEDHWKADMDRDIKELCEQRHLSECATRGRMYRDLEQKVNCNISARLVRLRERKKKQGCRHKDAMQLNKLDAIAADKQLRAAFELVLKEWQARSIVIEGQKEIIVQDEFELSDET